MKCCMVIPMYRDVIADSEQFCIQSIEKYAPDVDVYIAAPQGLIVADVPRRYRYRYYASRYFQNVNSYTKLLLKPDFYRPFEEYDFMLLCQLDAVLLRPYADITKEFYTFDYIGAPWMKPVETYSISFKGISLFKTLLHPRYCEVGNGGFSLRNIHKTIELLREKERYTRIWNAGEDSFFAYHGQMNNCEFKLAPRDIAEKFALEENAREMIAKGHIPIGIHAWEKYYPEVVCNM